MIVAHHGYGEEILLYAAAGGSAAVSGLAFVCRAYTGRALRWLRRR